jgi:hypothetical protein
VLLEGYCNAPQGKLPLAEDRVFTYSLAGDRTIATAQLICPSCHTAKIRRSRRRSAADYLFSAAGFLPWRCVGCEGRFRARPSPLRNIVYAHCRICGNLELQRISPELVSGMMSFLGLLLGVPALRCEPCRHKFFSVRPLRREAPVAAAPQRP